MKTLLVMAGGTGGHIMPGLAVAEHLHAQGWRIAWMGNPEGMESRLTADRDYDKAWIRFTALRGKGLVRKLGLPYNLLRACYQAWRELDRIRPDVVIGMGGYVSFPGGMMAVLRGIPLVLHEQNSVPGLANRVLALVAKRVLTGFPGVFSVGEWVGNPVRAELAVLPEPTFRYTEREQQGAPLRWLVVGGSLGAQALNEAVPAALALLPPEKRPHVVHQAGEKHLASLQAAYAAAGVEADCVPFIADMAKAYAEADLVICRAGALTVAELAAVGVASVLVPFPFAVDDHQTKNASFLADAGAAILLPQTQLTPERLLDWALSATSTRTHWLGLAQNAHKLSRTEATARVAEVCNEVSDKKSS
ncbi:MAG TPA: undecaprenyldiphospho-muramoylpentapeptide beta-N-acetylglucosaminyltransferase [Rhodocyclaceae bacterium]|nr:undecaprenyldiphospho-muramoylpentapeptide beta-N-acetylglucosaminyltransferase [Rhodocyclaceae bacterium]